MTRITRILEFDIRVIRAIRGSAVSIARQLFTLTGRRDAQKRR